MSPEEARVWVRTQYGVPRETLVAKFVASVREEQKRQNLVAPSTIDGIWFRHVIDSAQLLGLAGSPRRWLDIGTGGGFPGIVVAILSDAEVTLVEPRKLRSAFLASAVTELALQNCRVLPSKVEQVAIEQPYDVISARAVASLPLLFASAQHLASAKTSWLLPKGKSAYQEVAALSGVWQGSFHVKPSVTDEAAGIVIAQEVTPA